MEVRKIWIHHVRRNKNMTRNKNMHYHGDSTVKYRLIILTNNVCNSSYYRNTSFADCCTDVQEMHQKFTR